MRLADIRRTVISHPANPLVWFVHLPDRTFLGRFEVDRGFDPSLEGLPRTWPERGETPALTWRRTRSAILQALRRLPDSTIAAAPRARFTPEDSP